MKTPRTFGGARPLEELAAACRARGWMWDQSQFDAGGERIYFEFQSGQKRIRVEYNGVNDRFLVRDGAALVTEQSMELDGEKWYAELLDFLYLPNDEARR